MNEPHYLGNSRIPYNITTTHSHPRLLPAIENVGATSSFRLDMQWERNSSHRCFYAFFIPLLLKKPLFLVYTSVKCGLVFML